jgi:PucR C-terminal helix-turn-helix domain/GGDEF-like domain
MSVTADDFVVTATREVATALLPELPSIGDGTASYIEAAMPELAELGVVDLVRASCHANASVLLDALMRGVPLDAIAPSVEVLQTTRALVRSGVSHDSVIRGYQTGIIYWCARWAQAVEGHCTHASLKVPTVSHGTTFLLAWLQLITDRLTAEYRDEAERLARERSLARTVDVQQVLEDDAVDVGTMSARLGYDLGGRHLALVLERHPDAHDAPLESTARAIATAITPARPLVVRIGVDTAWCWVPVSEASELPAADAGVLVGQGRPASGPKGFRQTHREACDALRVAKIAGHCGGTLTRYDDVDLASLCSVDTVACRAFVVDELGPLAADTARARRLRDTLQAFFEANSNFRATAARLGLHHNTVRYRIDRAEALLGRAPGARRLHLELALHLAARLNAGAR